MPDISMCDDDVCPVRARCRRSPFSGTRPSQFRQSYQDFGALRRGEDRCAFFDQARLPAVPHL